MKTTKIEDLLFELFETNNGDIVGFFDGILSFSDGNIFEITDYKIDTMTFMEYKRKE
jgi:hypothetical protein